VRLEFAAPLIGSQAGRVVPRDPAELETPQVRRWLQESAAALGDETLAGQLLDDPRGLLERFIALLGSYWQDAFEREWERIEPDLAASVSEAGRVIAEQGLYPLLRRGLRTKRSRRRLSSGLGMPIPPRWSAPRCSGPTTTS